MRFQKLFAGVLLAALCGASQATVINFTDLANMPPGEGGADPISLNSTVTVSGFSSVGPGPDDDDDTTQFAYLDANNNAGLNGGLGVCKDLNSSAQCVPASDDNVTIGESLVFNILSGSATIDVLWFNNNHDTDESLLGDKIDIFGVTYTFVAADDVGDGSTTSGDCGLTTFTSIRHFCYKPTTAVVLTAGSSVADRTIKYNDEAFYVSAISITANATPVPAPAMLGLVGMLLLGFAGSVARRRAA